jgi:hypothetical protein
LISQPAFLLDKRTGLPLEAEFVEGITEDHLRQVDERWMPLILKHITDLVAKGAPRADWPQSFHWSWRQKMTSVGSLLAFQSFAVLYQGRLEGLMIANTAGHVARAPGQAGKDLAYIDFVETAPWNRKSINSVPELGGIGTVFMKAAIQLSKEAGLQGLVGLHSLPQSEDFYRICGMTDLGIDGTKENLRYFEMTADQADTFSS